MKTMLYMLLGLLLTLPAAASVPVPEERALEPTPEQRYTGRLATRFIASYNFSRTSLDTELSERIFDQYLKILDPNRSFFLASDIEDLERYRAHLDDALKNAEFSPAYDIFNRYIKRFAERTAHALQLLETDFDFTVDESYAPDRTEDPWAKDTEELNEVWRKQVKNDWLRLKLADQEDDEIRETLEKRYNNRLRRVRELTADDVFAYFMQAFARSVEPHSAYMSPRDADNFEISMSLSLEGIGALLERDTEYTSILNIVPGGPADLDGRLKPGDRIVAVGQGDDEEGDDEEMVDVVGWRLDDVVNLIRGPKDTRVLLQILPAETGLGGPYQVIELTRGEVQLEEQAASSRVIEIESGGRPVKVGVVNVPAFYVDFASRAQNRPNYRSTTRDVRRLINELRSEGVTGIVIDLRGNGGGALTEATTMTGLFIDEGPVVQVRDRSGNISTETDRQPGMAWEGPLAVLVDRNSASASEIFAAAIQDYGRGVVLGEHTYGKGTVQNLINLDEFSQGQQRMGQLRLTMAQFYRISGGSTQTKGVIPDILLPTVGDPEEYGESALEFALPWDQIDPAPYNPVANLDSLIDQARLKHETRLSEDQELQELLDELAEWERLANRESVSLLESVRREEAKAAESRRQAQFSDNVDGIDGVDDGDGDEAGDENAGEEEDTDTPDTLLTESARILADLIEFDRDQQLLAHHADISGPGK